MNYLKRITLALVGLLAIVSCSKYDDSALWNEVTGIKDRLENIESRLSDMNRDIQAIHTLLQAIDKNLYILSFNEVDGGYEIVLSDGRRLTIRHGKNGSDGENGKDGKDGTSPVIGVQMVNGVFYWTVTIDGKTEFLTDELGNKIPTTGQSSGSGTAPIIKVDYAGYWIISYDGGITYHYILDDNGNRVKATGQGGESFFRDVYQEGDFTVFVLADGTVIRIKSCDCDHKDIEDIVPPAILEEMDPYMNIYRGNNPPMIEGTYLIDPLVTVYCQDQGNGGYNPGDIVNSEYAGFFNQDNSKLTLDFKAESVNGTSYEKGNGSFIAGDGNNFTVYFNTNGMTQNITTRTALVISGTKTSSGIQNLEYAFVMVEKGADPEHILMNEGVFRVFKDKDGLSVKANHPFNFAPSKNPVPEAADIWFEFIRTL